MSMARNGLSVEISMFACNVGQPAPAIQARSLDSGPLEGCFAAIVVCGL